MQEIYWINLISPFIYGLLINTLVKKKNNAKKIILIVFSIQVTLIVGTRTITTGADTFNYYQIFSYLQQNPNDFLHTSNVLVNNVEILYRLVCVVCGKVGIGFYGANILIAAATMYFFSCAVYKMTDDVLISIFLYNSMFFVNNMMNQMRASLVFAIVLYATTFLLENKIVHFSFWTILAAGFHTSALIALALIPLYQMYISRRVKILYVVLTFVSTQLLGIAYKLISLTNYGRYLGGGRDIAHSNSVILNFFVRLAMLLIVMHYYKIVVGDNKEYNTYYHMAFLCSAIQALAIVSSLFARVTTVFLGCYVVLFPRCISKGVRLLGNRYIVKALFFLGFILYYYTMSKFHVGAGTAIYESIL